MAQAGHLAARRLELFLLGRPQIWVDGQPLAEQPPVKGQALLFYLACTRKTLTREALAGLFWGEMDEATARTNLRLTLSRLQKLVGPCLIAERREVRCDFERPIWIDVHEFETSLATADQPNSAPACAALNLYHSQFLHDFPVGDAPDFEMWVLAERERLGRTALNGLQTLLQSELDAGKHLDAINTCRRMLDLEPWHEEAHCRLMWLLNATDQRNAALAQYKSCCRILEQELGVPPAEETTALYEQIKQSRPAGIPHQTQPHAAARQPAAVLPEESLLVLPAENDQQGPGANICDAQIHRTQHETPDYPSRLEMVAVSTKIDWGEAPDVSGFHGRQSEVHKLRHWLTAEQCRLVAVLGMGGIGKTALATLVAASVQEQFTVIIWRSLRNAPPLAELLRQWLQVLSHHKEHELPKEVDQQMTLLMEYLRGQRCLLVLDNFETVLAGEHPGHYLPGYEGYGQLLKQVGEGRHQSCLLLTSREKPRELIPLAGKSAPVRTLVVSGLPLVDGRALLQDRGLRGSKEEWAGLHARYSGNPLALQIVSETIRELFGGDIVQFLAEDVLLFRGITDLLQQQFARLSPLEQEVMFWLAVDREPVSPEELGNDIVHATSRAAILQTLHALCQRFLVERVHTGFTLQNVVLEYVTAALIEQVCAEIRRGSAVLLQRHALLKASAKSYVRESQRSLILAPAAQRMLDLGQAALAERMRAMLTYTRQEQARQPGYAGGNILNLLVQLGMNLRSQDFSEVAVWQADLRNVTAQDVNFRRSDLSRSAFTDTFASVFSLAFSPDGQRVAAATMGEEIRVWQIGDGKPLATWVAHQGWVRSVCFSPDGSILASASGDKTVRLWNAADGRLLATLQGHTNFVNCACFSPDGSVLASGSDDKTIRLWDSHTGACLRVLQGHTNFVNSVCFSPDGSVLASGGYDQTVRLWDRHTGACLRLLQGHTKSVRSVCFNPDGNVLASGSEDKTIRLWNSDSGECLYLLQGHTNSVPSVCFSPDGNVLASGSGDQTVRLWDRHTGACLSLLQGHTSWVFSVCFSPDDSVLASGGYDQTVRLWDRHTGACLRLLQGHKNSLSCVCFSPDGNVLGSSGYYQTVRLWDRHTGACLRLLQGHTAWVWSVCFSPDGNVLASCSDDQTVRLWDSHTGACLRVLQGHTAWVFSACFSPDGNILASGGYDQTVRLWDRHTGACLRVLQGHTNTVPAVCFSPDGNVVASAGHDQTIRLWDRHTGECLHLLQGHTAWVWSVRFSPDGNVVASGGDDQTIRLWDWRTGECLRLLQGHTGLVGSVYFSPDGNVLASGSDDHTVRLWNRHTGDCLHILQGHTGSVGFACFSPDGSVLASCSDDETIRLWDANTGVCLKILRSDRPYERMNITEATGLTPTQIATLKRLGAVDDAGSQNPDDLSKRND